MSTKNLDERTIRLQLLCDKKTGHVFAAGPASLKPVGDDGPDEIRLVPADGEAFEEIELTPEQALISPPELFATHVVRNGRLVPTNRSPRAEKT